MRKSKIAMVNSRRGFSLIELVISLALLGLFASATASMFIGLHGELRHLSQKQEALELKSLLASQFLRPEVCSWQLKGKRIDLSDAHSQSQPGTSQIYIDSLFYGGDSSSAVLAKSGELLPATQSSLAVNKISIGSFYPSGIANEYIGTLRVSFDSETVERSLRPSQIQVRLKIDSSSSISSSKIEECGPGETGVRCESLNSGWSAWSTGGVKEVSCPTGFTGIHCRIEYYDKNSGVVYHGVGSGAWDSLRHTCRGKVTDGGISEGAVFIDCCRSH